MADYEKQFEEAHEVTEIANSDGFKILMGTVDEEIANVQQQVARVHQEMQESIRKGGVDSEKVVQQLTRLDARLAGLQFISNQVERFKGRKATASKQIAS